MPSNQNAMPPAVPNAVLMSACVRRYREMLVSIDTHYPDLFEKIIGGHGGLASAVVDGSEDVVSALVGYGATPDVAALLSAGAQEILDAFQQTRPHHEKSERDEDDHD